MIHLIKVIRATPRWTMLLEKAVNSRNIQLDWKLAAWSKKDTLAHKPPSKQSRLPRVAPAATAPATSAARQFLAGA